MQRTPYNEQTDRRTQANSLEDDDILEIRSRYADGTTITELAEDYDRARSTVYRIVSFKVYPQFGKEFTSRCLSRLEQNRKDQGLSSYKVQLAFHYGLFIGELADLYDVSERTIYRKLEGCWRVFFSNMIRN